MDTLYFVITFVSMSLMIVGFIVITTEDDH
jgi:hypothetical protein